MGELTDSMCLATFITMFKMEKFWDPLASILEQLHHDLQQMKVDI